MTCTYNNPGAAVKCEVCGTPRPQTGNVQCQSAQDGSTSTAKSCPACQHLTTTKFCPKCGAVVQSVPASRPQVMVSVTSATGQMLSSGPSSPQRAPGMFVKPAAAVSSNEEPSWTCSQCTVIQFQNRHSCACFLYGAIL